MRIFTTALLLGLACSQLHAAEEESWLSRSWDTVTDSYTTGTPEIYLPLHTHHLRSAYTQDQIDKYQETPYGLGYGRGKYNESGNWNGVYAMGFQDSHYKPEWIVGYTWKAVWGDPAGWRTGLGYTAGISTRADIGHYTPFPIVLPVASVAYGKASLETTYVPGAAGKGNVFFFWGKWAY
jgi:hypothetical protein